MKRLLAHALILAAHRIHPDVILTVWPKTDNYGNLCCDWDITPKQITALTNLYCGIRDNSTHTSDSVSGQ